MNNFMKLFAIFVVFIVQIQVALSQPKQPPTGPNQLIQQLCKRNRYQSLCISTLNLDPRSKATNLPGLTSISIDATTKKVSETLTYLLSVFKDIRRQEEFEKYGTCIEEYNTAVDRFLPAALASLKAKKYSQAMFNMKRVVMASNVCEDQFAGSSPLPMTERNKVVHDIADMTVDIIKTFVI